MLDSDQVESIINKSDMILDIMKKRTNLVFTVALIRTKVAFLGYQFIWTEEPAEKITSELLNLGFDNLTLTQILENFIFLRTRIKQFKARPKRKIDPINDPIKKANWWAGVQRRTRAGKY